MSDGANQDLADLVPPAHDSALIREVAGRVDIHSIDLAGLMFRRVDDDAPFPAEVPDLRPSIGVDAEWDYDEDGSRLAVLLTLGALFGELEAPYDATARFRLVYGLSEGARPSEEALEQFVYYNSVLNVWPYWRELLSSTLVRARLPVFVVPSLKIPALSLADSDLGAVQGDARSIG